MTQRRAGKDTDMEPFSMDSANAKNDSDPLVGGSRDVSSSSINSSKKDGDTLTKERGWFAHGLRTFMRMLIGREQLDASWQPAPTFYVKGTVFDTSIWTWGTDAGLTVVMWWLTYRILMEQSASRLQYNAAALTFLFGWSTAVGTVCHFCCGYGLNLNSKTFRFSWWLCVGSVAFVNTVLPRAGIRIC